MEAADFPSPSRQPAQILDPVQVQQEPAPRPLTAIEEQKLMEKLKKTSEVGRVNIDIRLQKGVSAVPGELPLTIYKVPTVRVIQPPPGKDCVIICVRCFTFV